MKLHDLSRYRVPNNCHERTSAITGLTLWVFALVGCASNTSLHAAKPVEGYRYTPIVRDGTGHYVSSALANPSEIVFYHYVFRRSELEEIGSDMKVAVKVFIERHQSIPNECVNGIRVVKIIAVENASLLTANVQCN